jgi:hypothetical protein
MHAAVANGWKCGRVVVDFECGFIGDHRGARRT